MLADEIAVYQAMPEAEREQEAWKTQRLSLAAELWKFATAPDTRQARRVVGLDP
jgi:hypothetical protein